MKILLLVLVIGAAEGCEPPMKPSLTCSTKPYTPLPLCEVQK